MRSLLISALVAGLAFGIAPTTADAKRLGGGKSYGMQRNAPDKPAQTPAATPNAPAATPNNAAAAAPTAGAAAAAAAAPKRSWMGPIAGLAAGLGIAALLGHLGLGAEFANFLMLALLAVVAFVVIRFLIRRFAGGAAAGNGNGTGGLAYAGAGAGSTPVGNTASSAPQQPLFKTADTGALPGSAAATWATGGSAAVAVPAAAGVGAATPAPVLPAGFDAAGFERIAKAIFIRLQAANDSGDLNDLRNFTTPELFAELRLDLQERGPSTQHTDVLSVEAQVLDCVEEPERQVVSVNFKGLLREEAGAEAQPFDEVWHLVKPLDGSRPWAIAGVQQRQ